MKASAWLFSAAMSVSCLALAQTAPKSTVTESTDPAKAAEVEHRAQELEARAQARKEREHMKKQRAHPSKSKAKQKPAKTEKAPSETPMDTESKG